jgi:glutathione S-transferase
VHRWLNLPVARDSRPNLERYYRALKARPASRQVTEQSLA